MKRKKLRTVIIVFVALALIASIANAIGERGKKLYGKTLFCLKLYRSLLNAEERFILIQVKNFGSKSLKLQTRCIMIMWNRVRTSDMLWMRCLMQTRIQLLIMMVIN